MANILSILIFLPILLSIPILFFKKDNVKLIQGYALAISLITFALSVALYFSFNADSGEFQFVQKMLWVKIINSYYYVGVDGISLLLILLTTLIFPISIIASYNPIKIRIKEYYFLLLLLEGALIGVFTSLDLILFYVFWNLF